MLERLRSLEKTESVLKVTLEGQSEEVRVQQIEQKRLIDQVKQIEDSMRHEEELRSGFEERSRKLQGRYQALRREVEKLELSYANEKVQREELERECLELRNLEEVRQHEKAMLENALKEEQENYQRTGLAGQQSLRREFEEKVNVLEANFAKEKSRRTDLERELFKLQDQKQLLEDELQSMKSAYWEEQRRRQGLERECFRLQDQKQALEFRKAVPRKLEKEQQNKPPTSKAEKTSEHTRQDLKEKLESLDLP